ncbi:MAG: hypothetical protein FJW27_13240 [Acidimicrobiia bacterium]|nr:hypothetical protein [Acidimicrobiia bacterium]
MTFLTFLSALRAHIVTRLLGRAMAGAAVVLAVSAVSTLTIDLGPSVRALAEREGSARIARPIHIGRLGIHLLRGRVLIEELTIDGVRPDDRPFLVAKQLSVALDWSKALRARPDLIITSVELTDWQMLVEKWPGGHNFIKLPTTNRPPSEGPRRFTTTLQYLRAWRGEFKYEDHEMPWSIVAPNIDVNITNLPNYHGDVTFHDGLVQIQQFEPMWAHMKARFTIDGSRLRMDHVALDTDGAVSEAVGEIDMARWPEQTYQVKSRVGFPRMREIFFAREGWKLSGDGHFEGVFHLFKGGHDLRGHFTSALAGVYDYTFPSTYGDLHWDKSGFQVTNAGARFSGGDATFSFTIEPLGVPQKIARFDASYTNVDLAEVTDFYALPGLRFSGRASGRNLLEWPMGRFKERHGDGTVSVTPPAGSEIMPASLDAARAADIGHSRHEWGPFTIVPLPTHLPLAAALTYRYDGQAVHAEQGRFATSRTHVTFAGATEWSGDSRFDFHVTSADWQESDQVLAGIMTDFGARTNPVVIGGRGEFDGVMTGPFRRPRVEGDFVGEDMRAWDTLWGDGAAHLVVENNYLRVTNATIRHEGSEIRAEGLYSLGYPRRDGGEEMDARFRVSRRDVDSLRHAFKIDDYPVSGLLSGEFHLTGHYETPFGFGSMAIDDGSAYAEPFERATAGLRFEGSGVRLDNIQIAKTGGAVEGAAFVGWNGTYSFNATGRRIPMERTATFAYPTAQPSGLVEFTAVGSGTFEVPRYDVRFRVADLSVGQESVGQVTGVLALRGDELSGEVDAASPRLNVTGTGRIGLHRRGTTDLLFRFHDSSLDPYVRLYQPKLAPYTTAVASGTVRVVGQISDVNQLVVDATVDRVDMKMFDYAIANAGPVRLVLEDNLVRIEQLRLVGEDTQLDVGGTVQLRDERIAVRASGEANLGLLQGFFRDVRGSGRARLVAAVDGPLYEPVFSGNAAIASGRVRHLLMPNSLDEINGTIQFDSRGIRLDDVIASMGGGRIQFGGRIGLEGYLPGELNITVRGENMRLRYPEAVRSTVDADLAIRGNVKAPTVGGAVTVKHALMSRRVDPSAAGLLDFAGVKPDATATASLVPIRLDIEVRVPSTLRIENNLARLVASADLQLRGTYDNPALLGRAEVDRGEVMFEGRRYVVTRGAIDFTNPLKVEPFFDVEAETRVRVPGQTYRVMVRAAGTMERLQPELNSDPPLPAADVLALLFSDVRRTDVDSGTRDFELQARTNPNQRQTDILTTRATQLLANPISSEVGRVVEQTFGVDTFQLTPSLIDPYSQTTNRVNPSARVTIGKRISDRVYLTFSRSLSTTTNDQILLLEYDESDRLSWILSRNEDQTYAIEVRVRHAF